MASNTAVIYSSARPVRRGIKLARFVAHKFEKALLFALSNSVLPGLARIVLAAAFLLVIADAARADAADWEYKVVIVQGMTAGGTIERESSGVYVDTKRTRALNDLAAQGWEVIAVIGTLAGDHAVYLRRRLESD